MDVVRNSVGAVERDEKGQRILKMERRGWSCCKQIILLSCFTYSAVCPPYFSFLFCFLMKSPSQTNLIFFLSSVLKSPWRSLPPELPRLTHHIAAAFLNSLIPTGLFSNTLPEPAEAFYCTAHPLLCFLALSDDYCDGRYLILTAAFM